MDNKTVPPDDKTEAMFGSTPQVIFRLNNLVVPKYVITFAWSNKKATLTEDMSKKSIRFFNDREVRAVWDEEHNKWRFSATDIVRAINDEEDYTKCRNYWKYLKGKFRKESIELVSATNQFKFEAPDGKQRKADACNHGDRLLIFRGIKNLSSL